MSTSNKNIVILGASFLGVPVAYKVLRQLPSDHHLVLVNPSAHLYWNIASTRAVVKNNTFNTDNTDLFQEFLPHLEDQPNASRFRFILGKATSLNPDSNSVEIARNDGTSETVEYSQLILATGAKAPENWPFKQTGTYTETAASLKIAQTKIEAANSIIITGGGATGCELAGEIISYYPNKHVTLINAEPYLLPTCSKKTSTAARSTLEALGVQVLCGTMATARDGENEGVEVTLSNGEVLKADLHIPAYGVQPNNEYIPKQLLDERGWVKVNENLRSEVAENIWAAGDIANAGAKVSLAAYDQSPVLAHNVLVAANGEGQMKVYKKMEKSWIMMVPMGPKFANGTGEVMGWKVPGFLVWLLKGRTYFAANNKEIAQGKSFGNGMKI